MPNESYRMWRVKLPFESQKESYHLISRMLIPKSLRFEVATFHRSWKGVCTATGQMAFPSSVSYVLEESGSGCFWCPWNNWDFLESFKFHHSTNFHSNDFHATFSRTLFWTTTSPGRWWPWWRCSMLGGGAKSRAGAVDDVSCLLKL